MQGGSQHKFIDVVLLKLLMIISYGGRSSVGRAPDCGSGCRGFKSRRSPHLIPSDEPDLLNRSSG